MPRPQVKEQALAKVDHAFGQLRQMKDGQLQGVNAEDLLDKLVRITKKNGLE